jgi:hypothetical protein
MLPRRYLLWTALSITNMAMHRRVHIDQEHFKILPEMFICLVGRQGLRKTTAMEKGRDMFLEVFPDYPVGASVMSREQIVSRLSSDDALKTFDGEDSKPVGYTPLAFFVNELKNFLSINPATMISFLTDIYGARRFASDTIKHGLQPIDNPCLNILACETPAWIIDKLKLDIITGGFSRRMIYVYETNRPKRIAFPPKTPEAYAAEEWCKKHLLKISTLTGGFKWSPEAKVYWKKWFEEDLPHPTDEVLEGFYEAKDVLAAKVSMAVALSKPEPKLILDLDDVQSGIALLEANEDNLPKLTAAAGKNPNAVIQQKLFEAMINQGGSMSEKEFRKRAGQDMRDHEYAPFRKFLLETEQIKLVYDSTGKNAKIYLPEAYDKACETGEIKDKE